MRSIPCRNSTFTLVLAALAAVFLGARAARDQTEPMETPGRIFAVTVHQDWASVTRVATFDLAAGQHEVRFTELPSTIEPASIRADAGGRAEVTRLVFEVSEDVETYSAGLADLVARLGEARKALAMLDEKLQVIAKEESLLDAIAERTAQQSGEQVGSGKIDLEEITRVSKYLAEQNAALLERRRGVIEEQRVAQGEVDRLTLERTEYEATGPPLERSALLGISVAEGESSAVQVQLNYLASGVRTHVQYNVRTDANLTHSTMELELELEQNTGELWKDVNFAYSTQPVIDPTSPPSLSPGLVESNERESPSMSIRQQRETGPLLAGRATLAQLVGQGGTVTSTGSLGSPPFTVFRISQPITIPSGEAHAQRLRLGTFRERPEFRYVAVPVISDSAFLRGTMQNTSRIHWLPGPASLFLGSEYVGETTIPYVAPGSRLELFFGTDHRVRAQRIKQSARTRSTGLLGDGRETLVEYRIKASNSTGQTVAVEVWDRSPMTRDERISVSTTSISPSVSRDEHYRLRQRSSGLLRWDVELPASGKDATIEYTLVVSHKSEVEVPDIPD